MIMYGIVPLAVLVFTFAFLFRFDFGKCFRRCKRSQMNQEGTGEDERQRGSESHGEQLRAKERVAMGGSLTNSSEISFRLEDQSEDLVPGLPNVIVVDLIATKLPWRAFHSLSSVSRSWRHAIRSRQVYDARVRSHSTETLFAFNHLIDGRIRAVSLYSPRDGTWHQLPQLPQYPKGCPEGCEGISLDGKFYVIGGDPDDSYEGSREVYALDLVEQREWKQCASMQEPRWGSASGVVGGKICVFGSWYLQDCISRSEIYDPQENFWSSIRPLNAKRHSHYVVTVGEELFVCGGCFVVSADNPNANQFARKANAQNQPTSSAFFSEVYHPGKDEWRLLSPFGWPESRLFFIAEGELHAMSGSDIRVRDVKTGENSWTALHSFKFPELEAPELSGLYYAHAVNGELFLLTLFLHDHLHPDGVRLLKSKGFRSGNASIVWEDVSCPLSFRFIPFMCPIQL